MPNRGETSRTNVASVPNLTDWRTDWLYGLVFRDADTSWAMCQPDTEYWQYVLICEWSEANGPDCCGKPLRAWRRDADGLTDISIVEYERLVRTIQNRLYPFILVDFHISNDRKQVVLSHQEANTAGGGNRYVVQGKGEHAKLVEDPAAGFWIS